MKFLRLMPLQKFIREQNIFPDYEGISEIYTGGSSYNFCIQTRSGKYFMKLLKDIDTFYKIKEFCRIFYTLYDVKTEIFEDYRILIMPYFEGHKMRYKDCSIQSLRRLYDKYKMINSGCLDEKLVLPMCRMSQLCAEIEDLFQTQNGIICRFIYKSVWKKMAKNLVNFSETKTFIHGDFTTNNIMIASDGAPLILDLEKIRYGYISEDWASLALELSGFRGLYGSLTRFTRLMQMFKQCISISPDEWLYGIQMFYISLLQRRLANRRKQSFRKQICLWLIMRGYFRMYDYMTKGDI